MFLPSDLMPLSSTNLSGVALYRDRKNAGTVGAYDPGDIFVPISATDLEWNADPSDPIVRNGGHYMVLKPTSGQDVPDSDYPTSDSNWAAFGYDYFVCIRTSKNIDYHDGFRCFIRDGDVKFRNSRNATGSGIDGDPIAANVPTFLNNLVVAPAGQDAMPIRADSVATAVVGMDMHDSNRTFEGRPSKLSQVVVHLFNFGTDTDFTSTDLAPFYQGYGQWVEIDPRTGATIPFTGGNVAGKRIGSRCGVALYRDAPNSDTPGGFDNPFDLNVTNPDTPVLLSGYEDWNFLLGWTYQVVLDLDPPMYDGTGADTSLVDPFDPEFYETLPAVDETEGLGNDFFVVLKTSPTISYGDDFYVRVGSTSMGGWVLQPLYFFPYLLNSGTHPFPWTPPFNAAWSFEDVNTQLMRCPTITITSFRDLTAKDNRVDATSDPIPVFGFDYHADTLSRETVNAVRVQARNISGFTPQMDLRPILGGLDGLSGVELYRDGNGNGVWDTTDVRVAIKASQWENVYYADNPGPDGVLATSDDLGTLGVYDPGTDELFLDDGFITGYYDLGDTLIEDGTDNIRHTLPTSYDIQDATLYALPSGQERWSLLMVPQTPIPVPQAFDGI
ncbi:MAG TPA: hypothetical protein PKH07_13720, partial [bacterium]|nr:hypothetical protein [bacterium]